MPLPYTILVVEDNELNLELMRERLKRKGFQVLTAKNEKELYLVLQEKLPDLILMDISLPGSDGLSITQKLKRDALTAKIPVIAVTAHAMPIDKEQAIKAGCDGYESKPVNFVRLFEKINTLLNRH